MAKKVMSHAVLITLRGGTALNEFIVSEKGSFVVSNGKKKQVKNLGWLRRNWTQVWYFIITPYDATTEIGMQPDCMLYAFNKQDELLYKTDFASKQVLKDWLNRPVFKGVRQTWRDFPDPVSKQSA